MNTNKKLTFKIDKILIIIIMKRKENKNKRKTKLYTFRRRDTNIVCTNKNLSQKPLFLCCRRKENCPFYVNEQKTKKERKQRTRIIIIKSKMFSLLFS